jgi:hypothetical protein
VRFVKIAHRGDDFANPPERGCPQPQHFRFANDVQNFEGPSRI